MRRFVLLAAAAVFLSGSMAPSPAAGLGGQTPVLPAVDAEGRMAPLTVDQLDPAERARFSLLPPGAGQRFLYTRGYLRYARLVVDGQLAPLSAPDMPDEEHWDRQFLSQTEAADVIDVANGMTVRATFEGRAGGRPRPVAAIADPTDRLPDVEADHLMQPLRVDQLDPDEQTTFASLAPGSIDRQRFLYSRGYLRFCRLVVAGDLSPLSLPRLPVGDEYYDRRFFSEYEAEELIDVAILMQINAMFQPAP